LKEETAFLMVITPGIAMAVITVVYSYFAYRKLNK